MKTWSAFWKISDILNFCATLNSRMEILYSETCVSYSRNLFWSFWDCIWHSVIGVLPFCDFGIWHSENLECHSRSKSENADFACLRTGNLECHSKSENADFACLIITEIYSMFTFHAIFEAFGSFPMVESLFLWLNCRWSGCFRVVWAPQGSVAVKTL